MKIHFPVVLIGLAGAALLAGCGGGSGSTMTPPMASSASHSAMSAPMSASAAVSSDPLAAPATITYISKLRAEQIALKAVGGGSVLLAVLETADYPVHWSIDIANRRGEFEVWVDARTGKVLKIIVGG